MKVHPAAELFPLMSDEEIAQLAENMRSRGYDPEKPVITYGGLLLDGRNRLRAAELADVEPVFMDLAAAANPYEESWRHNGLRRDLRAEQKAAIRIKINSESAAWESEQSARRDAANAKRAEAAREQIAQQPRDESGKVTAAPVPVAPTPKPVPGQPPRGGTPGTAAAAAVARDAGVSTRTVERVQAAARKDPEALEKIAKGEVTAAQVVGAKPKPKHVVCPHCGHHFDPKKKKDKP